jgi:hypothetical protein
MTRLARTTVGLHSCDRRFSAAPSRAASLCRHASHAPLVISGGPALRMLLDAPMHGMMRLYRLTRRP